MVQSKISIIYSLKRVINLKLIDLAKKRKTVRKFKQSAVPPLEDILYSIEVAKEAPSGMNGQPWLFYIVKSQELKEKIRIECEKAEKIFYEKSKGSLKDWLDTHEFSWKKDFLTEAPYLILVFSNKKFPFSRESVWLSIGYLLLALEEKELATVTYTPPNFRDIETILDVSRDYRLEVILPVGYSNDSKPKYKRKGLKEIVLFHGFEKE